MASRRFARAVGAGLLAASLLAATAAPASAVPATGSISGTLTLAAEAPGASRGFVELFTSDGDTSIRYASTDSSGRYTFEGIAPGRYRVNFCTDVISTGAPFGYTCLFYRGSIYATATVIEVGAVPVTGIDQTLRAAALVQGLLGPRSTGMYLSSAAFFPAAWTSGTPDWTSPHVVWANSLNGVYRVGLEPGDYRVAFGDRIDTTRRYDFERVEYWGGATLENSTVVTVRPGELITLNGLGAPGFSDVGTRDQFALEIAWLAYNGANGYPDGTYRSSTPVSREAMAAFLYRLAGSPAVSMPPLQRFWDVPNTHPFAKEITWLADQGVTTGYPDGSFRPSGTVNRDAMAAFLYRYAGRPAVTPGPSRLSDVPSWAPFATEIAWLADRRITTGYPDGTFRPLGTVNRDAMAAFLYRFTSRTS